MFKSKHSCGLMKASRGFMQTLTSLNVIESPSDHVTPCLWSGAQVFCCLRLGFVCQPQSKILVSPWQLLH